MAGQNASISVIRLLLGKKSIKGSASFILAPPESIGSRNINIKRAIPFRFLKNYNL